MVGVIKVNDFCKNKMVKIRFCLTNLSLKITNRMISFSNYFGNPLTLGSRTRVYANEILFFEGDINYTWIHFKSGKQKIIARTLLYIQHKIEIENFASVSRKHLVNRQFITEVGKDFLVLSDSTILPISRRRKQAILSSF